MLRSTRSRSLRSIARICEDSPNYSETGKITIHLGPDCGECIFDCHHGEEQEKRLRHGLLPPLLGVSPDAVVRIFASAQTRRISRTQYCSGLAFCRIISLATTMEECRAGRSVLFGPHQSRKRVIYWLSLGGRDAILPTFCPDCNEPTMEVVKHGPNDSYEARCTASGCHTFGKISPELLITKRAIDSTR
jgi:hypothetical protein